MVAETPLESNVPFILHSAFHCEKTWYPPNHPGIFQFQAHPKSKVHGVNMRPNWGQQDPGGSHDGLMNFAIWALEEFDNQVKTTLYGYCWYIFCHFAFGLSVLPCILIYSHYFPDIWFSRTYLFD